MKRNLYTAVILLLAAPGGDCESKNDGDPLVLYDDDAGQWIFAQFVTNSGLMCFAISQTSNPLGPYHRYAFQIAVAGGTPDYPKMGVWAGSVVVESTGQLELIMGDAVGFEDGLNVEGTLLVSNSNDPCN